MLKGIAIHKSFGIKEILHGIDIQIEPGTITTIIGPSGCGKSTLLRCLALLDPPTTGEVVVDDLSITFPRDTPVPTDQVWPRLTVVFQQLFLWPHITIRQNILLPLRSRRVTNPEDRAETLLNDFGITEFADRHPNEVSLGQRQLGAIARALALDPRYLLLDEITS
ncbi:MAG: ATP-binding cassette domain-containing protein, partial [Deltaproteobacteria bacterium]